MSQEFLGLPIELLVIAVSLPMLLLMWPLWSDQCRIRELPWRKEEIHSDDFLKCAFFLTVNICYFTDILSYLGIDRKVVHW